jgi:hypothetical protein
MVVAISTTVLLYSFVAIRSGDAVTQYNTFQQTKNLMKSFDEAASNAISCTNVTIGSVTALKCTMPNAGIDRDNSGIFDTYYPAGVYKTLRESYLPGKRIWFIPSTSPFSLGSAGKFWFRGTRTDDSNLAADNIDNRWSYVNGTTPRIYIPGTVSFSQVPASLATNITITLDPTIKTNAAVAGFSGNLRNPIPAVTLSRKFFWRFGS